MEKKAAESQNTKFSKETLIQNFGSKKSNASKLYIEELKNVNEEVEQIIRDTLSEFFCKKIFPTATSFYCALIFYRDLLLSAQIDYIEEEDFFPSEIHDSVANFCLFNIKESMLNKKGDEFFTQEAKPQTILKDQNLIAIGRSTIILAAEIVHAMAKLYPKDYYKDETSRYKKNYNELKAKQFPFPAERTYFKKEHEEEFNRNYKIFLSKVEEEYEQNKEVTPKDSVLYSKTKQIDSEEKNKANFQQRSGSNPPIKAEIQNRSPTDNKESTTLKTNKEEAVVNEKRKVQESKHSEFMSIKGSQLKSKANSNNQQVVKVKESFKSNYESKGNEKHVDDQTSEKVSHSKQEKAKPSEQISSKIKERSVVIDNKSMSTVTVAKQDFPITPEAKKHQLLDDRKKSTNKLQPSESSQNKESWSKQKLIERISKDRKTPQKQNPKKIRKIETSQNKLSQEESATIQISPEIKKNLPLKSNIGTPAKEVTLGSTRRSLPKTEKVSGQRGKLSENLNRSVFAVDKLNTSQHQYAKALFREELTNHRSKKNSIVNQGKEKIEANLHVHSQNSPSKRVKTATFNENRQTLSSWRVDKQFSKGPSLFGMKNYSLVQILDRFNDRHQFIEFVPEYFEPITLNMRSLRKAALEVYPFAESTQNFFNNRALEARLIKSAKGRYVLSLHNISKSTVYVKLVDQSEGRFCKNLKVMSENVSSESDCAVLRGEYLDIKFSFVTFDLNFRFLPFLLIVNKELVPLQLPITLLDQCEISPEIQLKSLTSYIENCSFIKSSALKGVSSESLPSFMSAVLTSEYSPQKVRMDSNAFKSSLAMQSQLGMGSIFGKKQPQNSQAKSTRKIIGQSSISLMNQNPLKRPYSVDIYVEAEPEVHGSQSHSINVIFNERLQLDVKDFAKVILELLMFLIIET